MFLNIAHRGDSTNYPENTLSAFESAIAAGASAVELDIRCTADGHVVVMHDRTGGRASNRNLRLAYHIDRHLIVLVAGGSDRGRVRRLAS